MDAESVVALLGALDEDGADAAVNGGWAVDALLGEQTRTHADLDLWIEASKFDCAVRALVRCGVDRLLPSDGDRPWNFVLHDGGRRRLDLHLFEVRTDGSLHFGSVLDGFTFPADALSGEGSILQHRVRCDAPMWSLRWHSGYPARPTDAHDMTLLCARFGLELPPNFGSGDQGAQRP
jgi:lincosamide nucleotidyltransferase A/C/D/E